MKKRNPRNNNELSTKPMITMAVWRGVSKDLCSFYAHRVTGQSVVGFGRGQLLEQ